MYELIPIFAGVLAGFGALQIEGRHRRAALMLAVAVVAGISASVLSAEVEESWLFVPWDVAQALATGALTIAAGVPLLWRRAASRSGRRTVEG